MRRFCLKGGSRHHGSRVGIVRVVSLKLGKVPLTASTVVNHNSEFVIVFRSGNWLDAYMAMNALAGHEIESIIVNEEICRYLAGAAWIVGGAKVLVSRADEEAALDVMSLVYPGSPPYVGSFTIVGVHDLGLVALLLTPWLLWRKRRSTPET